MVRADLCAVRRRLVRNRHRAAALLHPAAHRNPAERISGGHSANRCVSYGAGRVFPTGGCLPAEPVHGGCIRTEPVRCQRYGSRHAAGCFRQICVPVRAGCGRYSGTVSDRIGTGGSSCRGRCRLSPDRDRHRAAEPHDANTKPRAGIASAVETV